MGERLEAAVLAMFVAVPVAVSSGFAEPFTSVKWYVWHAFAIGLLAAHSLRHGTFPVPGILKSWWAPSAVLLALAVVNAFRSGPASAVQPLLERFTFVVVALCLFWLFRRNGGNVDRIGAAVCLATVLVDAYGLAQLLGYATLPGLAAGDHRSAFFGNANITAQFLGFAVLFLLSARGRGGIGLAARAGLEAVLALSFVYLYFLMCRSVFLALALALGTWLARRPSSIGVLGRTLAAAAVLLLVLVRSDVPGAALSMGPEALQRKAESFAIRQGLLEGTLRMIVENPLGVGASGFVDQFPPYLARGALAPAESVLYRSPHNEYLRVVAEEGWPFAAIAGGLLALFLGQLHRSPAIERWRSDHGVLLASLVVYLGVESLFQFPLALAHGSLMAAFIVALGLYCLSPGPDPGVVRKPGRSRAATAAGLVAAAAATLALFRVAAADWLYVNQRSSRPALERACALNPRNPEACVLAAWRQIQGRDHEAARRSLAGVLRRSPYYHPAIELLAEDTLARGRTAEGCLYLWIYDGLFRSASSMHGALFRWCPPEVLAAVRGQVAMPRYGTFPSWAGTKTRPETRAPPAPASSGGPAEPAS